MRARSLLLAVLSCLPPVLAAPHARAQSKAPPPRPPSSTPLHINYTVDLDFHLGAGTRGCPDEDYLRQEVARQIGYDPFTPDPKRDPIGRFRIEIKRERGTFTSVAAYFNLDGTPGAKDTEVGYDVCKDALKAAAFSVAAELTLQAAKAEEAAPPPPPEPLPSGPEAREASLKAPEAEPAPVLPVKQETKPMRVRFEVGAGALVALNLAPATVLGGFGHAGVHLFPFRGEDAWISLALEGRADAAVTGIVDAQHRITANLLAGSFLVCGHRELRPGATLIPSAFACATAIAGSMRLQHIDDLAGDTAGRSTYAGLGPRFGIDVRVAPVLVFRLHAAGLGALHPAVTVHRDRSIWATPSFSGDVGLTALLFVGESRR